MNERNWRKERDSRSMRYAGRVLNPEHWIALSANADYAARYDGQVAILTAANLLGRMSPAVALHIPPVPVIAPLPGSSEGSTLQEIVLDLLFRVDPYGKFCRRAPGENDYIIHLGRTGATNLAHGSGWNIYCGPEPSPLEDDETVNPIGPALSSILAISEAFRTNLNSPATETLLNALTWRPGALKMDFAPLSILHNGLGTLWTVGTGSVGTAVLYFLSLATQAFSAALFDMDCVKIHNLDRSPLFMADEVGMDKVEVTKKYLDRVGIRTIAEPRSLDNSALWCDRDDGVPDVLISTANERNVRTVVESGFPPLQIYGTTGGNWQAAVIRHIPLLDPCSTCLFPESNHKSTLCATGSISVGQEGDEKQVDAALPFLSFAAGAMAAAEIFKLCLPGYPFNVNRVILNTFPFPRVVSLPLNFRENCLCQRRSTDVHRKMVSGSRFAELMPAF